MKLPSPVKFSCAPLDSFLICQHYSRCWYFQKILPTPQPCSSLPHLSLFQCAVWFPLDDFCLRSLSLGLIFFSDTIASLKVLYFLLIWVLCLLDFPISGTSLLTYPLPANTTLWWKVIPLASTRVSCKVDILALLRQSGFGVKTNYYEGTVSCFFPLKVFLYV